MTFILTFWIGAKSNFNFYGIQQAVWQYGGATNIFSAFCSLIGFSSSRRITPSNRINNELLVINLASVTADESRTSATSPSRTVGCYVMDTTQLKERIWRIADGIPLRLDNCTIKINDNGRLLVIGWTYTIYFENVTKDKVIQELNELKDNFKKLTDSFSDLVTIIKSNDLKIEFHMQFDDNGKAGIGLCSEIDGQINWYI